MRKPEKLILKICRNHTRYYAAIMKKNTWEVNTAHRSKEFRLWTNLGEVPTQPDVVDLGRLCTKVLVKVNRKTVYRTEPGDPKQMWWQTTTKLSQKQFFVNLHQHTYFIVNNCCNVILIITSCTDFKKTEKAVKITLKIVCILDSISSFLLEFSVL